MKISEHKLMEAEQRASPNHGGLFSSKRPDSIIIHYTATATARQAVNTLINPRVKASAHLVVGRDGEIIQLVDFNTIAWHAGESSYNGRDGFNKFSIGIEVVNAGWLRKSGDRFISDFGKAFEGQDVITARHRNPQTTYKYWQTYSEKQIEVVEDICGTLIENYPIEMILGHEEIAPGRKQDPGPAYPLDDLRKRLLGVGADRNSNKGLDEDIPFDAQINATHLNIRAFPDVNAKKIANALPSGKPVTVLDKQDDWYHVRTNIDGWVNASFVKALPKSSNKH